MDEPNHTNNFRTTLPIYRETSELLSLLKMAKGKSKSAIVDELIRKHEKELYARYGVNSLYDVYVKRKLSEDARTHNVNEGGAPNPFVNHHPEREPENERHYNKTFS